MTEGFDIEIAGKTAELLAKFNDVDHWRGQNAFVASAIIGGGAELLRQACQRIRSLMQENELLKKRLDETHR